VILGIEEGLKRDCAVNLDHVQTVDKARLHRYVGKLSDAKMSAVCEALAIATGCDGEAPRSGAG
jgi:mRNA-degrading endonuclease toxin of MazEF toxin-antitoxin module